MNFLIFATATLLVAPQLEASKKIRVKRGIGQDFQTSSFVSLVDNNFGKKPNTQTTHFQNYETNTNKYTVFPKQPSTYSVPQFHQQISLKRPYFATQTYPKTPVKLPKVTQLNNFKKASPNLSAIEPKDLNISPTTRQENLSFGGFQDHEKFNSFDYSKHLENFQNLGNSDREFEHYNAEILQFANNNNNNNNDNNFGASQENFDSLGQYDSNRPNFFGKDFQSNGASFNNFGTAGQYAEKDFETGEQDSSKGKVIDLTKGYLNFGNNVAGGHVMGHEGLSAFKAKSNTNFESPTSQYSQNFGGFRPLSQYKIGQSRHF